MNSYVFGPPTWDVLNDAAVLADQMPAARAEFVRLLRAILVALMCEHCRASFANLMRTNPPDTYVAEGHAVQWIHWLHDRVNVELFRADVATEITWERFRLRASVWSCFGSVQNTFDVLSLMALTPRAAQGPAETVLPSVLEAIQLILWFAGAHPNYLAPRLTYLAANRPPGALSENALFEHVCRVRADFLGLPPGANDAFWREHYTLALVAG